MYELKKIGKVFTSKFVGTESTSYKKRIYRAALSQRLRNIDVDGYQHSEKEGCFRLHGRKYLSCVRSQQVLPKRWLPLSDCMVLRHKIS